MCIDKKALIKLRVERKISQYELFLQTGVEFSTISRIESGHYKNPTFETVARIAEFFEVPMETFKLGNLIGVPQPKAGDAGKFTVASKHQDLPAVPKK